MNIKNILFPTLFAAIGVGAQAQKTFTIEGQVKNVEDGIVLSLFRLDGNVGNSVGVDTISNGCFRFEIEAAGTETEKLDLLARSTAFPSMALSIWARPGSHVRISGENSLIYTWDVESDIPEQKINDSYIKDSRELWNEYQRCSMAQTGCMRAERGATDEVRNVLKAQFDSLRKVSDDISLRINANDIKRMKQTSVDAIWLDYLNRLAMDIKYRENNPYKADAIALYNSLTEELKQTVEGQTIHTCLFPPKVAEEGDEMVDADLYDLAGNLHHLKDFKGKYILLDFWSRGCGPCIMALPEMKELSEKYKDRLTIVSISIDNKKGWEEASKKHDMTWLNLNEMKGQNGLYARYGVRGIPNYVMITPEGRILRKWMGYGNGSLKFKLQHLLEASNERMTLGKENGYKVVNYPKIKKSNTDISTIRQVTLTDSATIVRIRACYIPKYWIQVAKEIQLVADNGTVCPIIRAEGIPLGEKFFMPESGISDYILYFAPLPANTRCFDMQELSVPTPDKIEGISLVLD